MNLFLLSVLVATFGLLWFLQKRHSKLRKLQSKNLKEIPGPRAWPFFGNLLQLKDGPSKQIFKWSQEFGKVFRIKLGNRKVIIISDPKLSKEVFSDVQTTGRESLPFLVMYQSIPKLGLFMSQGERWEVHRRFFLRHLRDFGFGKSSMEALILDEVNEVMERLKKAGSPVKDIRQPLRLAMVNSIWRILTSKRFDQDDPKLLRLAKNLTDTFNEAAGASSILLIFPWLCYIIPERCGYTAVRKVLQENLAMMEGVIQEKKLSFRDGELNDFIDVYLAEMKKPEHQNNQNSQFNSKQFPEHQLAVTLFDIFLAGTDSTALTIAWGLLHMCRNPGTQKKLQEEITEITGDSRRASVNDRPNMPYTLALLDEILRCSTISPDGCQHRALADVQFDGYLFEKNDLIQPNLFYIHHDPKIWGDPEEFRPERFLTPDGKKYLKNENLHGFQPGRRQCVGETLARDTVFLYLTALFQEFDMKFDPNEEQPTLEAIQGFLRIPRPFSIIMTKRVK